MTHQPLFAKGPPLKRYIAGKSQYDPLYLKIVFIRSNKKNASFTFILQENFHPVDLQKLLAERENRKQREEELAKLKEFNDELSQTSILSTDPCKWLVLRKINYLINSNL